MEEDVGFDRVHLFGIGGEGGRGKGKEEGGDRRLGGDVKDLSTFHEEYV